jgi:Vacuolar protein sorting 55
MIILSCALWHNWLPLLVGAYYLCATFHRIAQYGGCLALTFVLAPLPNALFSHCGSDEFVTSYGEASGPVDTGRFLTSIIVVSGLALPIILAHSEVIDSKACVMSIVGGA